MELVFFLILLTILGRGQLLSLLRGFIYFVLLLGIVMMVGAPR